MVALLQSITILVLCGCLGIQELRLRKLAKEIEYLYENQEVGK